jgi:tetratricopeptide (TPR) repeat protein
LAPDFVPEEVLIGGAKDLGPAISAKLTAVENDPVLIDDLLRPLVRYALVSRDKKSRGISVHRLVQAVQREQMLEVEQRDWSRKAVRALNRVFPEASYDQWPLCDRLLPHAKVAADYVARFSLGYEDAGFLLNEAAAFMRLRADFRASQQMHSQSLSIRERDLPADHPAVAESLNDTAFVYLDLYRYEDAEPLFRRAVEICNGTLPQDDPQRALHLNNLGHLYVRMGRCARAMPLLKKAEEITQGASADYLYMRAVVLNSLAELHLKMGNLTEAESECRRSLSIRQKIGNPEKLARSFVTLGEIQGKQGNHKTAEDSFIRALRLKSEVHGIEHPELIPVLMRYARLLSRVGRVERALELESRAERIRLRFELPPFNEADCIEGGLKQRDHS